MRHWASFYNNIISIRRATSKLMKAPKRASSKFNSIYNTIKAMREEKNRLELEALKIIGKRAKVASTSVQKFEEEEDEEEEGEEEEDEEEEGVEEEVKGVEEEEEGDDIIPYLSIYTANNYV
ncbi:unnamed protein product [Mucor hiemalis]